MSGLRSRPVPRKSANVKAPALGRGLVDAAQAAGQRADHAFRRQPQHDQQQHAEHQQAILGEVRDEFGQDDDDGGAHHRRERPAGAADDHGEKEQDRLGERKGIRGDEGEQRRKQPAGNAGERGGQREGDGLDDDGTEADGAGGDLGVAHRHHGHAPGARGQAVEEVEREPGEQRGYDGDAAFAGKRRPQRRLGNVHQAVLSAGDLAPLDGDVMDDEGEGDRHHGEIGP